MHYRRTRSKIDTNQNEIVKALRKIPGVTVQPGHDDLFVGYKGKNYWYEVKQETIYKVDGSLKKGALKDSQVNLMDDWQGHYRVVWTLDQITSELADEIRGEILEKGKVK